MSSAHKHRRPRKIRRTGRHAAPSQLQKAAEKAGKAAPAAALAGVLVTGQAHAAVHVPAKAITVAEQLHADAVTGHAQRASRSYAVRPGDTLSSIAQRFYGDPAGWRLLYQANMPVIRNPNVIFTGQVLNIPYHPPARTTAAVSRQARATVAAAGQAKAAAPASPQAKAAAPALSGTLSCAGLEELWEQAGGSRAEAFMAASIAMAESSGEQYATGPFGERGYWQINPDHGSLSTYDPLGNARAAIAISDDGTNWTPWTTFTTGAYHGRC